MKAFYVVGSQSTKAVTIIQGIFGALACANSICKWYARLQGTAVAATREVRAGRLSL